jgi:hypothetical protein
VLSRSPSLNNKELGRARKEKGTSRKEKRLEFVLFPPFAAPNWKPGSKVKIYRARVLSKVYACPCCMSLLHVPAAFQCCLFMLHVRSEFLCFMSMMHMHAACPCCMRMLHNRAMLTVHSSCPCCVSMLHVLGGKSMLHVHSAFP